MHEHEHGYLPRYQDMEEVLLNVMYVCLYNIQCVRKKVPPKIHFLVAR